MIIRTTKNANNTALLFLSELVNPQDLIVIFADYAHIFHNVSYSPVRSGCLHIYQHSLPFHAN